MKLRTLVIVAASLAVATSVGYYIRNASLTTPEDDPLIGTKVFDQDILKDVKRVEIAKDGEQVVVELEGSNNWVVRSLYDLPADFAKLNTLIRDLVESDISRKITAREDRLGRLDLTQGTLKLMSGPEDSLFEITYGKSINSGKAFVFGHEKTAYLSSESPYIDASSSNWATKTLYEFQADEVAGIQFSLEDGDWGVRRDDKDKDFVSTLPVDVRIPKQTEITSLIGRFTNLRFTEVTERAVEEENQTWKDAQKNTRSLKLTLFSGETITIEMSQQLPPEPAEGEEAPTSPTPSVTYLNLSSSQADHAINGIMGRLAFQASSYTFTGIPLEISEVADLPAEDVAAETENAAQVAPAPGNVSAPSIEEVVEAVVEAEPKDPNQTEIKQHIDGNSVIFEVIPPKKEGEEEETPAEDPEEN
ncbi:MAG: DUF4340 domain-containing protein [Opitutales bacterium]|nr:DUF4340 domain-containing protein [Opitutales bacterium]